MALQLTASVMTIAGSWVYGNKRVAGPMIGLLSQVPWWALMFHEGLWGLFPVNFAMVVIHIRNTIKWWRE